jgi:hypothetical protein
MSLFHAADCNDDKQTPRPFIVDEIARQRGVTMEMALFEKCVELQAGIATAREELSAAGRDKMTRVAG